jgi:hydrogenase expression/formation protein HypE
LEFEGAIESDTAPLNGLVMAMLDACRDIHVLRDPTRGGLASALNEIAASAKVGMVIDEARVPLSEEVRGACEILGLDPLYVANEGKLLAIVPPEDAGAVLRKMQAHPMGRNAALIGEVSGDHPSLVIMKTLIGGRRIVDMLSGEQLPRIC